MQVAAKAMIFFEPADADDSHAAIITPMLIR